MLKSIRSLATLAIMGAPAWVILFGVFGTGPGVGAVVVQVNDPIAEVWVGDRRLESGSRQYGPLEVEPGEHRVRVIVGGFPVYDRRVAVEPGSRTLIRATANASYHGHAETEVIPGLDVPERSLPSLGSAPTAVGSSQGGQYLVSSFSDGTLAIYNASTGQRSHLISAHEGRVLGMTVLADGRHAITASDDQYLRLWDLDRGVAIRSLRLGNDHLPVCMAASTDGRRAAVGFLGGMVQVFDMETGREIRRRTTRQHATGSLAFSPDGTRLLLGLVGVPGTPHPVILWNLSTGADHCVMQGHDAPVWAVAFLPDGRALTGGSDHTMRLWDTTTGAELRRFENHPGVVFSLAVSPDGRYVLSGTGHQWADGWAQADAYGAQVWDLEGERSLGRLTTSSPVRCVAFSSDGKLAIAGSDDRKVRSWALPAFPPSTSETVARRRAADRGTAG
ncbi:MAG: WD40 repeat domain-containing protein [Isosphaeraceae bacterium]